MENHRKGSLSYLEDDFSRPTPDAAIAARRSQNEFLEVPCSEHIPRVFGGT